MQMSWVSAVLMTLFGAAAAPLPPDVRHAIEKDYVAEGRETRYVDGSVDLNGDGRNELLVHVVGSTACGTGGCPTLVFSPAGAGYRLVGAIGLTHPPIAVSPQRSNGWRNLVVRVGGGGAKADDVELAFDGKTYPANPTAAAKGITPGNGDSEVVIAPFASFDDTRTLTEGDVPAVAVPIEKPVPVTATNGPSFDCAKATLAVEKAICLSPELGALDRELATTFEDTVRNAAAAQQARQRTAQKVWLGKRNDCGSAADAPVCLREAYRRRLVDLQIQSGRIEAPTPHAYRCKGYEKQPFLAAFYPATDPPAVMLTWGERRALAFVAPSGSGARYAADDVDFWEHEGEITVKWSDTALSCSAL
ncbi:MAG TPA: MliC family protein [Tahibacter sp.]|uniref:MliC family protein n=1 Tax=Tahibacter sp. TaxID=2056211 RepID=UPI002BD682FA|nr:MliC family protein [Tahibacter sp.]HSX59443.1 MliC family protein [Tahibacter sp.]